MVAAIVRPIVDKMVEENKYVGAGELSNKLNLDFVHVYDSIQRYRGKEWRALRKRNDYKAVQEGALRLVAQQIKTAMFRYKVSVKELSLVTGLSGATIHNIKCARPIGLRSLINISEALGMRLSLVMEKSVPQLLNERVSDDESKTVYAADGNALEGLQSGEDET